MNRASRAAVTPKRAPLKRGEARILAARYARKHPAANALDQFEMTASLIREKFNAAKNDARSPYDRKAAVLRRWVYRFGHAYRKAGMVNYLRAHVQKRDGLARWGSSESAFFWVIRLLSEQRVLPEHMSKSEWAKMLRALDAAERLDIHSTYLEHFLVLSGRIDTRADVENLCKTPPLWIRGLTRTARRIVRKVQSRTAASVD